MKLCKHMRPYLGRTFPELGAGDYVAKVLEKVGVTKKEGCGCGKRQQALNTAAAKIGFAKGVGEKLHNLPRQPMFGCALHDVCIKVAPDYATPDIKEVGVSVCLHCHDFEAD